MALLTACPCDAMILTHPQKEVDYVVPSSHLILCRSLLLLPPIPFSIRVFPMSQLFT